MAESDIARIRRQIALEYEASQRIFTDFTPTASHEFQLKRQENIAGYFEELRQYMSPQDAIVLVSQTLDHIQDSFPLSGNTS